MEGESFSRNEIIDGEIQLMKSAYANEFEEIETSEENSNGQANLQFRIKLGPHHTRGGTLNAHVSAVVLITTSYKYPEEPAELSIESCSGIMDKDKDQLEMELKTICLDSAKSGTVVMMDISQITQNFLSEHARPYVESVYDEMIAGQKAKEKALQQAEAETLKEKEKLDEERRILIKEEMERVQEAMKKERRERRERMKRCCTVMPEDESKLPEKSEEQHTGLHKVSILYLDRRSSRSASECSGSGDLSNSERPAACDVSFTSSEKRELAISPLANLGERSEQFCSVVLGREKRSRELYVMYSWAIRPKKMGKTQDHDYILEEFLSKLYSSEKEMSSLLKLSHENLVPFEAMKIIKPLNNDFGYIHILQEYVQGHSLKVYFDLKINLPESLIHHIASGVVKALDYLHLNNVVHRNIRDSCVFLDHEYQIVRLADYGVERRCVEAILEYEGQEPTSSFPLSPGRGGKKSDVFRFGLLLLSLSRGMRITEVAPKIPSKLSSNLTSFLTHCLELSEHDRWTSHQLVNHPFILSYVPEEESVKRGECLHQSPENMGLNRSLEDNDDDDESPKNASEVSPNLRACTRFHVEYDFIELLGKGGFGQVYKVRNKVDDRVYALKQISLHHKSDPTRRKMIREVKLLSSLNHENVVRYYTSWIETITQSEHSESRESSLQLLAAMKNNSSEEESGNYDASYIESESEEGDTDWLMACRRISAKDEESDYILFQKNSDDDDLENQASKNSDEDDDKDDIDRNDPSSKPSGGSQPKRIQYLFIQMQYCEKNTLRQAIDHSLHLDEDRVWRLFRELINGLDYIHNQGLIHRDLKPGNIFLDSSDHVKIGDFGLATVAYKEISTDNVSSQMNTITLDVKDSRSALTADVGTALYIAPELTNVLGKISYSNKVDIYSLGIIFFEMIYPFSTGMERNNLLSALRVLQPQFPKDFASNQKQKLILWLLTHNPVQRPSTKELLSSPLLPPPTEEEQKFMATLDTKIKNVNSKDYQDILKLMFKPFARPELEATFEFYMHKVGPKHLLTEDFVKNRVIGVFKSHGAICVPTSFYIPSGSFYQKKENAVILMTRGGEMLTAQFELRYPFARFIARTDIKHLRRYSIDRVQRALKISGVHPIEIYECAFDIIAPKYDLTESCARVVLVAQDILRKVSGFYPNEVTVKLCHSDLIKLILNYCGIKDEEHDKVTELLYDFRAQYLDLEQLGKCLRSRGIGKKATDVLKDFYRMEGSVDDVCARLQTKMLSSSSRRRDYGVALENIITEIKEVKTALHDMEIEFEIVLHPLMVVDHGLYQGISFQLALKKSDKKPTAKILAQGGSYEHLIAPFRNQNVPTTKRTDVSLSAVGISLPLDRILTSGDLTKLSGLIEAARVKMNQGQNDLGMLFTDVFICAVEERQLKERMKLKSRLTGENITVDHGFASGTLEAEMFFEDFWFIPHFVFMYPKKVIIRSSEHFGPDRTSHFNERKIDHSDIFENLCKLCKNGKEMLQPYSGNVRKESFKYGSNIKPEEFVTPAIEVQYILKKQTRSKQTKVDEQILEEVRSYLLSRCPEISVSDSVEVFVLDVSKTVLLALGQLDVETTVKNFNDSAADIKKRFSDIKYHLEKILEVFRNSIFYKKKSERPNAIICYSNTAECLKRIY